jgi:hypothetical protein
METRARHDARFRFDKFLPSSAAHKTNAMMQPDDLDEISVLADRVKAVHGDDVYTATLERALAMASRESVRTTLTTEAVLAAVRIGS